jgi:hypothetical protein
MMILHSERHFSFASIRNGRLGLRFRTHVCEAYIPCGHPSNDAYRANFLLMPDAADFIVSLNRGEDRAGYHQAWGVLIASTEAFAFGHDSIEK